MPKFKLFLFFLAVSAHAIADQRPNLWDVMRSQFTLNHEVSRPEVQAQIRWLSAHPGYLKKASEQAAPYIYHIVFEIKKRRLPGELALLPMIESAFNPFAYSRVGAAGLWQIMPATGAAYGLKQDWWYDGRRSIDQSTRAALSYLSYLKRFFNGNWIFAIASYDAGEGTVSRAVKSMNNTTDFWSLPVPNETKMYVPRLLALSEIIMNPDQYKIVLPNIPFTPYFQEVSIGSQIDLNHAAKLAGITYKELIALNPGFNHWTTTPYEPFYLLIPRSKSNQFMTNLSNFPVEKRVSWTKYQVRAGDNLKNIAARYHTTESLIKQLNQLKSDMVSLNQFLLIPSTKNMLIPIKKEMSPFLQTIRPLETPVSRRTIHIVQPHDSFEMIQQKYQVSIVDIRRWNHVSDLESLKPGQILVIWRQSR